jgi:hypothetical protein
VLDNFYKLSNPPEYVTLNSDPKRGFKNVYAVKTWHGVWGFNSPMRGDWPASFSGNCDCPTPQIRNMPDTTKYLTVAAEAHVDHTGIYGGQPTEYHATAVRSDTVGRNTGKHNYGGYDTYAGDESSRESAMDIVHALLGAAGDGTATLVTRYCNALNAGATATLDLAAGTFTAHYDLGALTIDESMSVNATTLHWERTDSHRVGTPGAEDNWDTEQSVTVTLSYPYTSAMLNQDVDDLLAHWDLLDDNQYPWRTDGAISRGPLVTYNECGILRETTFLVRICLPTHNLDTTSGMQRWIQLSPRCLISQNARLRP